MTEIKVSKFSTKTGKQRRMVSSHTLGLDAMCLAAVTEYRKDPTVAELLVTWSDSHQDHHYRVRPGSTWVTT